MKTDELREAYLSFFESKGCIRRPSDVLVPNDPTVMFTPAGMNQFKEQFLGIGKLEYTRATTCQKCIRTGDIENVGKTRFHMTFFEMLGNFSFGDYFKREAIHWAWEFVTKILRIPPERLQVTVYQDDDEAYGIWHDEIKLPGSKIRRSGEADNFWPAGAPSDGPDGVCGPCSEIFVDLGNGDEVEIWNLVFTQFNRVGYRQLEPLPRKNIDTGMGLERTAAVVQGVPTSYDIDIFRPLIDAATEITGVAYDPAGALTNAQRLRRMAEHTRTVTFCLHENVLPGPKQQGYVVRRLLRRAVLDVYRLNIKEPLLYKLVPAIAQAMRAVYPEIADTAKSVADKIRAEEERFLKVVDNGVGYLEDIFRKLAASGDSMVSGEDAFRLHDTYGFPIELTEETAASRNISVDRDAFEIIRKRQSEQEPADGTTGVFTIGPLQKLKEFLAPTEFLGYRELSATGHVKAIIAEDHLVTEVVELGHKDPIVLVLERTPFYGESGGQVGDTGTMIAPGFRFEVTDTKKKDGYILHEGHIREGSARQEMPVIAQVDAARRAAITRAHSATHILHAALHEVLGEHAKQAGSKVEPDMFRFDFSHAQAMSGEELTMIERRASEYIMASAPVSAEIKPIEEARKMGAMALFGEKYGDEVRVVSMGAFSREFCGGCHLGNTGQVGPLKIVREEGIAAGTRRITAVTGVLALQYFHQREKLLAEASSLLRCAPAELPKRVEGLQKELRDLQKSASQKGAAAATEVVARLLRDALVMGTAQVVAAEVEHATPDELRQRSDELRAKAGPIAILLASTEEGKVHLVASVSKELIERGLEAGKWVAEVAPLVGGKGGGKPHMAQAGGREPARLPDALNHALLWAKSKLT